MADSGSHKGTAAGLSQLYLQLAEHYEDRSEPKMRDRFLILAADAATTAGQDAEAERLLQRLLRSSPHHMLKAFGTFAEAIQAEPIRMYIDDLRKNYPAEIAENLLTSLRQGDEPPPPAETWATPLPVAPERPGDDEDDQTIPGLLPADPDAFNLVPEEADDTTQLISQKPVAQPRPAARPEPTPTHTPRPTIKPLPLAPTDPVPPRPRQTTSQQSGRPQPGARTARKRKPREDPGGGWLSLMLFGVVLMLGLVLVYYAFLRTFFHVSWLP
jgi:hypothetical protein